MTSFSIVCRQHLSTDTCLCVWCSRFSETAGIKEFPQHLTDMAYDSWGFKYPAHSTEISRTDKFKCLLLLAQVLDWCLLSQHWQLLRSPLAAIRLPSNRRCKCSACQRAMGS